MDYTADVRERGLDESTDTLVEAAAASTLLSPSAKDKIDTLARKVVEEWNKKQHEDYFAGARLAVKGHQADDEVILKKLPPRDRWYVTNLYDQYTGRFKRQPVLLGKNLSFKITEPPLELRDIIADAKNREWAKKVHLTLGRLAAGSGSRVLRREYLRLLAYPDADNRDKASDLRIDIGDKPTSFAEFQFRRALVEAKKSFGGMTLEWYVSEHSRGSYERLLSETNIDYNRDYKGGYRIIANRQLLNGAGIKTRLVVSTPKPSVDVKRRGLTTKHQSGGSHGEWVLYVLLEALRRKIPNDGKIHIKAIANGDGSNDFPPDAAVGYAARNKIPILILTRDKTPLDEQFGAIGQQTIG